jgi:hypothetical protein
MNVVVVVVVVVAAVVMMILDISVTHQDFLVDDFGSIFGLDILVAADPCR